jgi:hypothetical protein
MGKYDTNIESYIAKNIADDEFIVAEGNQQSKINDFESAIDMLECERSDKDYDWMSDIFIPEFPSIIMTDASLWVNQYFQNRDFVSVFLEGDAETDQPKCNAVKKVINKTLNVKGVYHYQKYVRARLINALCGEVYVVCWWQKDELDAIVGYNEQEKGLGIDVDGNEMVDPTQQEEQTQVIREPVFGKKIKADHFNYDVIDPRNVFTDDQYCYSIQDKDWVIIRSEKTYNMLKADEEKNGYFNLDIVKKYAETASTPTARTIAEPDGGAPFDKTNIKWFDVLERFGKYWSIVKARDDDGNPTEITPGVDENGRISTEAELVETLITIANIDNNRTLIRYQATPFIDANGYPFKPIIRGLCYIHPTKDKGLSDGKYMSEIQKGINDTFNMSNDRVKLATLPTFKGRKYALEDNDTVFIEPEHVIELENPETDLMELVVRDDVSGAMNQIGMLKGQGNQVTSIYPTTMGNETSRAETATAISATEGRTNMRANYKSLTFEYTFLTEMYWMLLQMFYRFASEQTATKIMGEDGQYFDPVGDYTYKPVTSSIELEYNKMNKIRLWDSVLSRIANVPNPNVYKAINFVLGKVAELMGEEYSTINKLMMDEGAPPPTGPGREPAAGDGMGNASNEQGIPMGGAEQALRGGNIASMGG